MHPILEAGHGRIRPATLRPGILLLSVPVLFQSEACAKKGVSLAIFLSSSFQSCPPPSFVLSERPNILALRSLRKAAAELFARRDGTT